MHELGPCTLQSNQSLEGRDESGSLSVDKVHMQMIQGDFFYLWGQADLTHEALHASSS